MGKLSSATLVEAQNQRTGQAVAELDARLAGLDRSGCEWRGFSVRPPNETSKEFLLVLRAIDDDGLPVVAFHGATDLGGALVGLVDRLSNGSLRWREDEFATKQ